MKKRQLLLSISLLLLSTACSFESDALYTDDTTEECQLYDYYIDEYGNEGIVAYVYQSKSTQRKEVIVISADEALLPWGPTGMAVYQADTLKKNTLNSSTFGVSMHQSMKSIGIDRFPAQAWCDAKNGNEPYPRGGSWRLPSFYEMNLALKDVDALNAALTSIGGTTISVSSHYWTCVEDYSGYITINGADNTDYDCQNRAVITSASNSTYSNKDRWLKKNKYNVRAIKYVYFHNY